MSVKVVLYKILNKNVKVKFPILLSMLCDLVYLSYVNLEPIIPSALNFKKTSSNFKKFEKEIIVIDDGSTDNTKNLLENNKDLFDTLHTNEKNKGKGSAVRLGLKNASGTYVVFQDADLEYDPNDLLKFEPILEKNDKI